MTFDRRPTLKEWHRQRIRARAYSIREGEGQPHGNDLAHWFQAKIDVPLRVTFDSNTYRQVLPCGPARDASRAELGKITEALTLERMRGYLSETIVTVEGIQRNDRVGTFGSSRVESKWRATSNRSLELTIALRQSRSPLHPGQSAWIDRAQAFGFRFLRTGSRWFSGAGRIQNQKDRFFEPDPNVLELADRMSRIDRITEAIQAKGLGYARAVNLGLKFSARDRKDGEWWLQALKRARNDQERRQVILAVSEWADGDSVAAHIGYELDLFCTADKGKNAGGDSILSANNRQWLKQNYGVKFVTLRELAAIVS